MADFTIDDSQLAAFATQLAGLGVELADLDDSNTEAGRVVLAATRPPRASGYLAASVAADVSANGVVFASTARYWTFVHWGAPRRNIQARPFFRDAVRASETDVLAVYAQHAADAIKQLD